MTGVYGTAFQSFRVCSVRTNCVAEVRRDFQRPVQVDAWARRWRARDVEKKKLLCQAYFRSKTVEDPAVGMAEWVTHMEGVCRTISVKLNFTATGRDEGAVGRGELSMEEIQHIGSIVSGQWLCLLYRSFLHDFD